MSMGRISRLGIIAVLAAGTVAAPVFAGGVTVGRLYAALAEAKELASPDAAAAEVSLRNAGFNLPRLALDKSLTEGDLTTIATAIGIVVTTQRPSQMISESQLNTFMFSFRGQIAATKAGAPSSFQLNDLPPQSSNGKGKKKGHHKSTSQPI